jgi:hypothetical protein
MTKGFAGTMEVLAGCSRESKAAAPGAGSVIGSPFTHALIKHVQEQPFQPHGLLITELQTLLSLDEILEDQSPIRVVLMGHYSPIKLRPLLSETELQQNETREPVTIKPGLKALLSVSFRGEACPDIEDFVQWLNTQRLKEVYKIEIEALNIEASFDSCSTLILLSMPVSIWAQLQGISGLSLVGFIKSRNLSIEREHTVKMVL